MANQERPLLGGTYKRNDGELCRVHFVSECAETGELVVVYEPMYSIDAIRHCLLDAFMEKDKFILFKHPALILMD